MPLAFDMSATALLIRRLESSANLSGEERQAIESLPVKMQAFDVRRDIGREGDKPAHCCLILSGWACRYKLLNEGKRQILSFHIPGDMPDLGNLHVPTRNFSLATVTNAIVAFIPHENLRALATQYPKIAALLWRDTLTDAENARVWLTGLGRRSALERVSHLLCELYVKLEAVGLAEQFRCPMPMTQVDLADALGLTSVHINRVLMGLRGMGLITLRGQTLIIEAWDELRRICEFDPAYLQLETRTTPIPGATAAIRPSFDQKGSARRAAEAQGSRTDLPTDEYVVAFRNPKRLVAPNVRRRPSVRH